MKIKILNIFVYIFSSLFFILPIFNDFNHLLFKNSFSEINSRIPGGIKISIDKGLTSYGMFEVGYSSLDKKYNGQSLENNIYEYTKNINVNFLENEVIPESSKLTSYQKGGALYSRILPFIIYKFMSLISKEFIYLELAYILISLFVFLRIYKKIQSKFGCFRSIIFFVMLISNSYFILMLRSIAGPFFIFMWIVFLLSFKKIRYFVYQKESFFILIFLFLPPSLLGNNIGPLLWASFLTASYLFENEFKALKRKSLVVKTLILNGVFFILNEFIWISQRLFILKEDSEIIRNVLISSFGKYFNLNLSSTTLNSCADITWYEFLILFINIKMNDFILFEIRIYHYFLFFILIILFSKLKFKTKLKYQYDKNLQILFVLSINFLWFALIKGAFSCHLHVYPKLFIMSFIPILITFKSSFDGLNLSFNISNLKKYKFLVDRKNNE